MMCICVAISTCDAQMLENKVNLYVGYLKSNGAANEKVNDGNFTFPSLYNNFKTVNGASLKYLSSRTHYLSAGIDLQWQMARNWKIESSDIYKDATMNMLSVSPVFQFHNAFAKDGVLNRFRFTTSIQPTLGHASINLASALSDAKYEGIQIYESSTSDDTFFFGGSAAFGIEWTIAQRTGVFVNYGVMRNWIKSSLCMDTSLTATTLQFGMYRRFSFLPYYY
jgi:hypothetical protein